MTDLPTDHPVIRVRSGPLTEAQRRYIDPAGLERMARWSAERGGEVPVEPRTSRRAEDDGLPPPPICAPVPR